MLTRARTVGRRTASQRAGERCRFGGHAFHQIPVAGEDIGNVVDDVMALSIERRRQPPLRDGEANAVREALTQRSRGDLNAWRAPVLRVTGRSALPLSELLDVIQ